LCLGAIVSACAGDLELSVGERAQPIIGGHPFSGLPAVAMIQVSGSTCTATLVSRRVLLTAGHCLINAVKRGSHQGRVLFGPGGAGAGGFSHQVPFSRLAVHRYYSTFQFYDIGMVLLAEDAPAWIEPLPYNLEPLPDLVGVTVRVVGYGVSDGVAQTGLGTKREIELVINSIGRHHIAFGGAGYNICQGDSGGPTLLEGLSGAPQVIAVSSYGSTNCVGESRVARTDAYADWLAQVHNAWEGACALDGVCATDCRDTIDPDCDACGFDGVCGADCQQPDLDCPLGKLTGEICQKATDCEFRTCASAREDSRVRFCSRPCDPALPLTGQCEPPLSACDALPEGGGQCSYAGITPGVQGAPCTSAVDCRGGVCDPDYQMCVEPCGNGFPACADGYECIALGPASACALPREGGCGCALPGPTRFGTGWPGLILVALVAVRLRRRGRRPGQGAATRASVDLVGVEGVERAADALVGAFADARDQSRLSGRARCDGSRDDRRVASRLWRLAAGGAAGRPIDQG
jgi:hypothetical protein